MDEERAGELANASKALGDPVRLRLLSMIASRGERGEVCVCDLTPAFELSQPTAPSLATVFGLGALMLGDLAGQGVGAARPIRDEIERRVRVLLTELGVPAEAALP
ncbi:DNA-binding transcriptional ArsR family regulator [Streptomyces sp. 3330]|nr:DNA-binding transcriptional ArsR family regulator [Streptomyces sp. 3330]